jgi:ethanolamine permease
MFGSCLTICYAYSKLIAAMADSKLLPPILSRRAFFSKVPIYAVILGQVLGLLFCVYGVLLPGDDIFWSNIIALTAFVTYAIQMCGFIVMRTKLSQFKKDFVSPFGVAGALFGLVVFIVGIFSCIFYHSSRLWIILVYLVLMSVYYWVQVRHKQTFSVAERSVVLPAHVAIRDINGKSALSVFPVSHGYFAVVI